jgi:hypothetical protein
MTLAQMVDIEEYYREGILENAHRIVSVIMLPAKRKWKFAGPWVTEEYEPSEERENDMLKMDMETIWGNMLFFSTIVSIYTKGLLDFSVAMLETEAKTMMSQSETQEERR